MRVRRTLGGIQRPPALRTEIPSCGRGHTQRALLVGEKPGRSQSLSIRMRYSRVSFVFF